jgi:hypothetical protein
MTPRQFAIKVNSTFVTAELLKEIDDMFDEQVALGKSGLKWIDDFLCRIDIENASKRAIEFILRETQSKAEQLQQWQPLLTDFHSYLVKYCDDLRSLKGLPYPGHDAQ